MKQVLEFNTVYAMFKKMTRESRVSMAAVQEDEDSRNVMIDVLNMIDKMEENEMNNNETQANTNVNMDAIRDRIKSYGIGINVKTGARVGLGAAIAGTVFTAIHQPIATILTAAVGTVAHQLGQMGDAAEISHGGVLKKVRAEMKELAEATDDVLVDHERRLAELEAKLLNK
jgi:hypothetical protein